MANIVEPQRPSALRWLVTYAAVSLGSIAAVLLALWVLDDFQGFGLDTPATIATVVGILVTSALGVGLMGLMFYSDRSNVDEDAYHATAGDGDPPAAGNGAGIEDVRADRSTPDRTAKG
jgi:hypothetical protein